MSLILITLSLSFTTVMLDGSFRESVLLLVDTFTFQHRFDTNLSRVSMDRQYNVPN